MITLFDILVIAAILGFAYWGWLVGLERAGVAALEVLGCLVVAVLLHEAVAGFLLAAAGLVLGDWASQAWAVLLAFGLLAWGGFAAVRFGVHREADEEELEADIDPLGDRLGGAVAGGAGGAVFAGGVLVTLSMVPFLAGLKPSGDRMLLDVGKLVLRSAAPFAGERHEGRSLPIEGEPPASMSNAAARLTNEPWFDANDDGKCDDADRYRDVDGSSTFTKDLYYTDSDGNEQRRVGLVDKYVAGRWDSKLNSDERKREQATAPQGPPPANAPPGTGKPGAKPPAKPDGTKPSDTKPGNTKPSDTKPGTKPDAPKPDESGPEPGGKRPEDDF